MALGVAEYKCTYHVSCGGRSRVESRSVEFLEAREHLNDGLTRELSSIDRERVQQFHVLALEMEARAIPVRVQAIPRHSHC